MENGIHELTAGYALDVLDADERWAYETHLASCERCRDELTSFWETAAALAVATSGPAPSPGLRDRILAAAHEERQVVVPLESRRRRRLTPVGAAAAVAALVAVAVGLWASQLSGDLDDARLALERERAAAAVLADPDSRSVSLQEGEGRMLVAGDGQAVLVLEGLDPAPAGKTYEMWIVSQGGAPERAGLFPGGETRDVVPVEGAVEGGQVVLVTIEDAGGVDAPTTDPIVGTMPA